MNQVKHELNVLLLSDSTGETVNSVGSVLAAQFPRSKLDFELVLFLRTKETANQILENKYQNTDIIIHSLVDVEVIDIIKKYAKKYKVQIIEILGEPIRAVEKTTKILPLRLPGQQYKLNENYYNRINAIDFAM